MKARIGLYLLSLAPVAALAQTPVIADGGVLNAASYVKGQPPTPGSLVAVFGADLASGTTTVPGPPFPGDPEDEVQVTFNGTRAPLLFVSPTQINVQIPWTVTPGTVNVVVVRGGVSSQPRPTTVAPFSPGIFTLQSGLGQAVAINHDDSTITAPPGAGGPYASKPAKTDDYILLYATGLGAVSPAPETGADSHDQLRYSSRLPTVLIGGRPGIVTFAGLSPEFVGVNQINVQIPDPAPSGDAVPIQIQVGGITTPEQSTIALAGGGVPQVPAEYQDLYGELKTQLTAFNNTVDSNWDGTKFPGMAFSGEAYPADVVNLVLRDGYYNGYVTPFLDKLQSLGVKAVKVQMGFPILYEPFFRDYLQAPQLYGQYLAFYQRLLQDVHNHGMKFISQAQHVDLGRGSDLAGNGRSVGDYYKSLSWDDYQAARSAFLVNVATQLRPDYLLMQTEAENEATNTGKTQLLDVPSNTAMLQRFLNDLAAANAHTMVVGAGMGSWYANYKDIASSLLTLQGLDLLDIHVYPINRASAGGSMWQRAIDIADMGRAAGKKLGVSEAWLYKLRDSELGPNIVSDEIYARDVFSFWAPLDMQFLKAMLTMGHWKQMDYVNASYDRYFFGYISWEQAQATCGGPCTPEQLTALVNDVYNALNVNETGRYYNYLMQ